MAISTTLLHSAQDTLRTGGDRGVIPWLAAEITALGRDNFTLGGLGSGAGNEEQWDKSQNEGFHGIEGNLFREVGKGDFSGGCLSLAPGSGPVRAGIFLDKFDDLAGDILTGGSFDTLESRRRIDLHDDGAVIGA